MSKPSCRSFVVWYFYVETLSDYVERYKCLRFSYIEEMKGKTESRAKEKGELKRKNSMPCRTLACSFKRSCSIVNCLEELAEKENTEEKTSETNSQEGSHGSSHTEEEKAVPEEKKEDSVVSTASAVVFEEFQYKPAAVPEKNRFQAEITFVDSQGYIYAQELNEGKLVPFAVWQLHSTLSYQGINLIPGRQRQIGRQKKVGLTSEKIPLLILQKSNV